MPVMHVHSTDDDIVPYGGGIMPLISMMLKLPPPGGRGGRAQLGPCRLIGRASAVIDVREEMWAFFRRFSRPEALAATRRAPRAQVTDGVPRAERGQPR